MGPLGTSANLPAAADSRSKSGRPKNMAACRTHSAVERPAGPGAAPPASRATVLVERGGDAVDTDLHSSFAPFISWLVSCLGSVLPRGLQAEAGGHRHSALSAGMRATMR